MRISYCFVLFIFLVIAKFSLSQECFDAYDLIFENGGDTLSYNDFHQRELQFLNSLNGCKAIDFSGTTLDNEEIILSTLNGKVIVLNFWFTTCLPCLKEIPELNKLIDLYDADEVIFIGLARDNMKQLETFFNRFGPFVFKIIPESYNIATQYKVIGWPQTMVIDKNGVIFKSWAGLHLSPLKQRQEIEKAINNCLAY